jgi:hypothetical protein
MFRHSLRLLLERRDVYNYQMNSSSGASSVLYESHQHQQLHHIGTDKHVLKTALIIQKQVLR